MIHFLSIKIQEKGRGQDYRAFLTFADSDTMMAYEIRGYGSTAGQAADAAYTRYAGPDRDTFVSDHWPWE